MFVLMVFLLAVLALTIAVAVVLLSSAAAVGMVLLALAGGLTVAKVWHRRHAAWKREWSPKPQQPAVDKETPVVPPRR